MVSVGSVITPISDYHQVFGYSLAGVALALLPVVPVLGLVVALVLRRTGPVYRWVWGALVAWTAAILLVTLTPGRVSYHPGVCAFFWSGTASDLGSTDAKILNVLMFVPLGFLAALLVRRTFLPLALALLLSPAIELVQREFPSIRRSCDLVDVIDNVGGAVAGAAIGFVLVAVGALVTAPRTSP
jgi:VanZ like protein